MKLIIVGTIKEGIFDPENSMLYDCLLKKYEGKRVSIDIKAYRQQRTIQQNKYYWKVIIGMLCDHIGYTPEEMHNALKWKFMRKYEDTVLPTVGSTTELDVYEFFKEFIEKIQRWSAIEFGLNIPDPPQFTF